MVSFLIIYLCVIVAMFLMTIKDNDCYALTPKQIYECNDLNIFACVLLSILATVTNPLLITLRFLHWIFHVGRKDG